MLGVIGGTGLTKLSNLEVTRRQLVRTPYGEPSGPLVFGVVAQRDIVFLARHGHGHTIPPHLVNYRANLWAMHSQGVENVVSVASVGGIRDDLGPGVIAVPDQIIDYTWGRRCTLYEGEDRSVVHIDFTRPYCDQLRMRILDAATSCGEQIIAGGVYAATQGPRLETAAEINRLERDGADMVGMTGMPEAALAREIGLCYAAIAVVANHAAGRGESRDAVHMRDINATLNVALSRVRRILEQLVENDGS
ncbi:MAG: S-methyl-5'-thioinosine phosphorylase [Betaproteobacteria bacterium]